MTNRLRSTSVSRSRRVVRLATRAAITTSMIATVAAVAVVAGPGGGRTIEAAGEAFGAGGEYHAVTPTRILDTRDPALDVPPLGRKPFQTASSSGLFDVVVTGTAGLPAFVDADQDCADDNVLSVVVNITVVHPTSLGYLEAFGKGENPAVTSLVNFQAGNVVANTAILRPGCDGALSIRLGPAANAVGDVLVDVFGWFSSSAYDTRGARLEPFGPSRIFDSREAAYGATPIAGGAQRKIPIRGASGIPNDVVGVLVNVTGVNQASGSQPTFLSLVPEAVTAGAALTSNVNLRTNQVRSNLAVVPVGADGSITVYNGIGNTHVVLDVMGYFVNRPDDTRRGRVVPLVAPFRAFDTRQEQHDNAPLPPGMAEDWSFADFAADVKIDGNAVGAQLGVIGNLTGAELQRQYPTRADATYLTAYPTPPEGSATDPPLISNLGMQEGEVVPNLALLQYGANTSVRFYNRASYLDYLFDASAIVLAD
jgi:hypothetical protein